MSSELEDVRHQLAALTARVDAIEGLRAMMDRDLGGKLDMIVAMLERLTPPGDGQA
jgi:hypothetical protein